MIFFATQNPHHPHASHTARGKRFRVLPLHLLALVLLWTGAGPLFGAHDGDDATPVGFDLLAGFPLADEVRSGRFEIPAQVRQLDSRTVILTGFMLPLRFEDARVTEFLLLKDQNACCFGRMPRLSEWIVVKAAAPGLEAKMDIPVHCRGRFSVGERTDAGIVTGMYFLEEARLVEKR